MNKRYWLRDANTQNVYVGEVDGNSNVVAAAGPIPWHEVGHVVLGRYVTSQGIAANLRGATILSKDEVQAIARGYSDRRGLPVLDGTPQDRTQPDARPGSVPGPNPPEMAEKPEPDSLPPSETTDHPEISQADQSKTDKVDEREAGNQMKGQEGDTDESRRQATEDENDATGDDPIAEAMRRALEEKDTADKRTMTETAASHAEDPEQDPDRPGIHEGQGELPPGADQTRVDQLVGGAANKTENDDPTNPDARARSGATRGEQAGTQPKQDAKPAKK